MRHFGDWLKKGIWSILDQALFAGVNFLLNVMLARWLSPESYGAFTVAFSIFTLLGIFHTALLTEPMLVYGAGRYKASLKTYLRLLTCGHIVFSVAGAGVLALVAAYLWINGAVMLAPVMASMAAVQPFMLYLWLMRRACYVKLRPQWAVVGGIWYLVLLGVVGGVLFTGDWVSAEAAFGMLAVAGTGAGLWIRRSLYRQEDDAVHENLETDVLAKHWAYGRWSAATGLLMWVPGNMYFLVLPIWAGLDASGELKALNNIIMPPLQVISALSVLLLPTLVRVRQAGTFGTMIRRMVLLFVGGSVIYWLVAGLWGETLLDWIYGGQYLDMAPLLWIFGALPVTASIVAVLGGALRAREQPDRVFWAYVAATLVALTGGLGATYVYGVAGAIAGLIGSSAATGAVMAWLLARRPESVEPVEPVEMEPAQLA